MLRVPIAMHERLERGDTPLVYMLLSTPMGWRGYAEKELGESFDVGAVYPDGTWEPDGTVDIDGLGLLSKLGLLRRVSSLERTISPQSTGVLSAFSRRQRQRIRAELLDPDRHIPRMLPREPILGRACRIVCGFEDLPYSEHLPLFDGEVVEVEISRVRSTSTITADETQ